MKIAVRGKTIHALIQRMIKRDFSELFVFSVFKCTSPAGLLKNISGGIENTNWDSAKFDRVKLYGTGMARSKALNVA